MIFLEFDSGPLIDSFSHLKDSQKIQENAWIIGLYKFSWMKSHKKNVIAKKLQGNNSIYS